MRLPPPEGVEERAGHCVPSSGEGEEREGEMLGGRGAEHSIRRGRALWSSVGTLRVKLGLSACYI